MHVNPVDSNLMVTCSNDWTVRLNDVRMLGAAAPDSKGKLSLVTIQHIGVTSPVTKASRHCLSFAA